MALVPLFWKIAVQDAGELRSWAAPGLTPVEHLHVTLLYVGGKGVEQAAAANHLSIEEYLRTQEALLLLDGSEVSFEVTAVLQHSAMIVAEVTLPEDVPCAEASPHLTLCTSPLVRPVFAKDLISSRASCVVSRLSSPLRLSGIVALESGINERAAAPGEATTFVGSLLKMEANPRPSRQTEPSGCATFLFGSEEEVRALAARLAASVKEQPPGPPAWKLKAKVQAPGRPGHVYLKWAAVAGNIEASEIGAILEARLQELM